MVQHPLTTHFCGWDFSFSSRLVYPTPLWMTCNSGTEFIVARGSYVFLKGGYGVLVGVIVVQRIFSGSLLTSIVEGNRWNMEMGLLEQEHVIIFFKTVIFGCF